MEAEENTQLSLRWKVKRSSEKFASEEYIVVFFAAESSEEQASERSLFKDLSPRYIFCVFIVEKIMF